MFNWYNASTIENLRRQDEIAAAEKFRMIEGITNQDTPSRIRQQHILARLGVKMVDWGYRLQSRYDELVTSNVSTNIHGSPSSPC
jgi:hypothetical protein